MREIKEGAGFVVAKKFDNCYKFLSLVVNDKYDIPKGMVEENETYLEAAVRECYEESGLVILPSDMKWGIDGCYNSYIKIYLAETEQEPYISPNPHSGIYEHDYYLWMDPHDLRKKCIEYLEPSILWAINKIGL